VLDGGDRDALREEAEQRVQEAVEFAEQSPEPDVESLGEHLYGDPESERQLARMATGAPHGES
jgi:TPP-dependent pyruvate/acetoin dehydrogenase alpha subunit